MTLSFLNRSIGRKLSAAFIVMLLLVILAGVVGSLGVLSILSTVQQSLDTGFQINDLVKQARLEIVEARNLETFYLANYVRSGLSTTRGAVLNVVPRHISAFADHLLAIQQLMNDSGDSAWSAAELINQVESYQAGIVSLIDMIEQRGAVELQGIVANEYGYIGEMHAQAVQLENVIQPSAHPDLYVMLLDLFREEKNYLLNGEAQVRLRVNALVSSLREGIAAEAEFYDVEALDAMLDSYLANFTAVYQQDQAIERARQTNSGTIIAIDRQLTDIETMALQRVTEAREAIFSRVSQVLTLIPAAIVIAIVLGGGLAMIITRGITRPLDRILRTTQAIGAGDLSQRVSVHTSDEVGVLARSFNQMTEDLQDFVESEQVKRARLETVIAAYTRFVQEVADGNLMTALELDEMTSAGDSPDDLNVLGANLNHMVVQLGEMARQIRQAAHEMSSAAAEILATSTQQLASAAEQESAVTQTMATVEEVQTTVKETASRAQRVADKSQESVTVSRTGQEMVTDSIAGMSHIRDRVEAIAENILALSERTQQIGEIIATVNALAEQSKLLALNASIEAARAGEEGRGFAVVAMEIRQLAEQSRAATARVADILHEIQSATNTAVMVTEEGSKGVTAGMQLVTQAGEAIQDLAATIEESAQAATQIAASTHQQMNGMEQLLAAMVSIKQTSSQTATSSRQAEKSAQDLNKMAGQMETAISRYQV